MAYLRTYLNEICTVYGEARVKYGELQDKISEIAEKRNGVLRYAPYYRKVCRRTCGKGSQQHQNA